MIKENKKIILSYMFVALFYAFAHGYRFFNNMFSGDALVNIYQRDWAWQISLGRVFQPIYLMFRGTIANPWLISLLAVFFIGTAEVILVDLFSIKKDYSIAFLAAILTCNSVVTTANVSFLPWADIYALAFLLAVWGSALILKKKWYFVTAGIILLASSMALYQAYICVAIVIFLYKLIEDLQAGMEIKKFILKGCSIAVSLILSGGVYFFFWKVIQKPLGIWTSDGYNGLNKIGTSPDEPLSGIILGAYRVVADFFFNPMKFISLAYRGQSLSVLWVWALRLLALVGLVIMLFQFANKLIHAEKKNYVNIIFQCALVLLLPLAADFVYVLSKGTLHDLMKYAFVLLALPLIICIDNADMRVITKKICLILSGIILFGFVWNNIVASNQIYLKRQLQEDATRELVSRIVYDIEHTDGYVPGQTEVAIVGYFDKSYVTDISGMEEIQAYGMSKTSLTYYGTEFYYMDLVMNVDMDFVYADPKEEVIKNMPTYPQKGSVAIVDGVLVVKISE